VTAGVRWVPSAPPAHSPDVAFWVMSVYVGALEFDLLLGDVRSLKQKRSVVRPLIAELRKRFEVSVSETGYQQLHRRAMIAIAMVGPDVDRVTGVLDGCERFVASRPETELLSTRRRWLGPEDE